MSSVGLLAQEADSELMVVYLKDGSKMEGYIQKWDYETKLYLKSTAGSIFEFPAKSVDKVVQKSLMALETGPSYTFNEAGIYYAWRIQGLVGNNGGRFNDTPGYGFSFLAGYRTNRLLGVGIGVGYDKLVNDSGEEVIPVFAEFSGYLQPVNTSLYYSLGVGYSFARENRDLGIIDGKGGLLLYPAIGVRFGDGKLKYTMDLGYKFQKASFTYLDRWNPQTTHEQRLTYRRLTLRFGILI
jgi:hypothetical protein